MTRDKKDSEKKETVKTDDELQAVDGSTAPVAFGAPEQYNVVFEYVPREFPQLITSTASDFIQTKGGKSTGFRISELAAKQSGVEQLKKTKLEEKIEKEALEKLKTFQEEAYKEAYELGIIEGTEKAFQDHKADFERRLTAFDQLLDTLENLKERMVSENEAEILKVLNLMATRIAVKEINADKETILRVLTEVIDEVQSAERILVRMSDDDLMFVNSTKEKLSQKLDFLKRVKIEPDETIQSGGCFIETHYGNIDATLEQRIGRVWKAVESRLPKQKDEADLQIVRGDNSQSVDGSDGDDGGEGGEVA